MKTLICARFCIGHYKGHTKYINQSEFSPLIDSTNKIVLLIDETAKCNVILQELVSFYIKAGHFRCQPRRI